MAELIILIAGSAVSLLLALVVFIKNPQSATNRIFAILAVLFALEPVPNYLSLHASDHLLYIRLTMVVVVLLMLAFRWLSAWFPRSAVQFSTPRYLEAAGALVAAAAMASPIGFTHVTVSSSGNVSPSPGPGMGLFLIFFAYAVCASIYGLIKRLKHAGSGSERAQIQYMFTALILLFGLEIISSMILPLAFQFSGAVQLTPLFFAAFDALITVAIIREHLFDIRAVVARSVAYLLLLGTLVVVYAILIFGLSTFVIRDAVVSTSYRIANVTIAVVLAFTFPFLKRFFDHLTNRLFFREAYDLQPVIKTLSEVLVSEVTLKSVVHHSLKVLVDNLKTTYAVFVVCDGRKVYYTKHLGTPPAELPDLNDLEHLSSDLANVSNIKHRAERRLFEAFDLDACVRLRAPDGVTGFILLGAKKSGNVYSAQDIELLQIASKQIAVATQNSLHYEKISRFNAELQERVVQATYRLRQNNQRLRALDETKDDFISMASHQLRTPLTSVKGYLSLVLEGDAGKLNEQQHKLLAQSFASSQRMVYLISDLLNVSRLRTGKFIIEPAPVNLAEIITDEIEQLQETAATRSLTLSYEKPTDFPVLMLDETKTRQVIMNFIDNAIYYTPAGGRIDVQLVNKPSTVELRVVDDGIGVPKSEQHHLFTKFYRAGNARKARPDGTGLGLFMAKKVITAQGGALIFESQEGKGSTFGFILNKARLAVPATSHSDKTPVAV